MGSNRIGTSELARSSPDRPRFTAPDLSSKTASFRLVESGEASARTSAAQASRAVGKHIRPA
eukprot:scaffold21193_cov31-Tisochrysis_lutea.AAC.3